MTARELFEQVTQMYENKGFQVTATMIGEGVYDLECLDPDGGRGSIASTMYEFEEGDGKEIPDRYRHKGTTPGCFFSEWHELQ